jgi:hypothetical protein
MKIDNTSNLAVMKALGLDGLKRVTAINIKLRVGQLPSVVIWQHLDELGSDEPALQRFQLVPVVEDQPKYAAMSPWRRELHRLLDGILGKAIK